MADPDRPLLADLKEEVSRIGGDLSRMLQLRWQLAQLEFRSAVRCAGQLAVALAAAAIMALVGLSVLTMRVAGFLDARFPLAGVGWPAAIGLGLLAGTVLLGWMAWRRFRRRFAGLEESVDELREDLVWIREWLGRPEHQGVSGRPSPVPKEADLDRGHVP
jgi:hypothetical protein